MTWTNRIVAEGTADPYDLLPNPENWRVHSEKQDTVVSASLDEVGFVQSVIVNQTTGRLVDGHLRAAIAIRKGLRKIPVTYVELSEAEEQLALATLDPISAMAAANAYLFGQLLETANTGSAKLMEYLDEYGRRIGAVPDESEKRDAPEKTGAAEFTPDDFNDFEHHCPECGFQFNDYPGNT